MTFKGCKSSFDWDLDICVYTVDPASGEGWGGVLLSLIEVGNAIIMN
jgi:hypothetical protein